MKELWQLYVSFFRVSICLFGGGYAALPLLERELVDRRGWADTELLADLFALAQCTPGVIAVNAATFIGTHRRGVWGAIAATLGMLTPCVAIVICIAAFLMPYLETAELGGLFGAIMATVCALILLTVVRLFRSGVKTRTSFVLFAVSLLLTLLTPISPSVLVLVALVLGLGRGIWRKRKETGC